MFFISQSYSSKIKTQKIKPEIEYVHLLKKRKEYVYRALFVCYKTEQWSEKNHEASLLHKKKE